MLLYNARIILTYAAKEKERKNDAKNVCLLAEERTTRVLACMCWFLMFMRSIAPWSSSRELYALIFGRSQEFHSVLRRRLQRTHLTIGRARVCMCLVLFQPLKASSEQSFCSFSSYFRYFFFG